MYINKLFVFGTLLPGLDNYKRFLEQYRPKYYPARAEGVMYYLPEDGYPVVLEGKGEVKGVLFDSDDLRVVLPEIDDIQKYTGIESQSYLIRKIVDVENLETGEKVKAHMYLWPPSKAQWLKENGVIIYDGDWMNFLETKE
ncbi:gamma-glutamylcyclotransferase family protein [Desulfotruncus alcoholivorax]|uniref:gamma-glutamylcyclotransferase family protein n=1 Tax=Desulfotruncus alcoholivorax TaxID=265477 RepID=UPI0004219BA3|nr:gamma-glutamylcyclotransferase family protein [Desulfotruncus alcoholivorax]